MGMRARNSHGEALGNGKEGRAGMLSELVIWYLFLGGVGGGAYLGWCALGWYLPRRGTEVERRAFVRATPFVWMVALAATAFGVVFLLADLTRPGQAHLLFLMPTLSLITVGAFALLFYLIALAALLALWHSGARMLPSHSFVHLGHYGITGVLALVTVLYTGFYLMSLSRSIPLWHSAAIPLLFFVSALSTGIAVVALAFVRACGPAYRMYRPVRALFTFDALLVIAEMGLLAYLLASSWGNVAAQESVRMLIEGGALSDVFWTMLVGVGLVGPCVAEIAISVLSPRSSFGYIVVSVCVLVGGFFLRYCLVHAGVHIAQFMFTGFY